MLENEKTIFKVMKARGRITFGEQLKCVPGTGSVVTYIVIHRYRYSVPTIQKNLLLIIDLEKKGKDLSLEVLCGWCIIIVLL